MAPKEYMMKRIGKFSWAKTSAGALRGEAGTDTTNVIDGIPAFLGSPSTSQVAVDPATVQETATSAPATITFDSVQGTWNTQPAKVKVTIMVFAAADQNNFPGKYICTASYVVVNAQTGVQLAACDFSTQYKAIPWVP